jgi:hypothetical protein
MQSKRRENFYVISQIRWRIDWNYQAELSFVRILYDKLYNWKEVEGTQPT